MRGVEFIGVFKGGGKVRDAVRGVILVDAGPFNESLMVFYLGGTIWKRPGRRGILEKILRKKDRVFVQRYSEIRFQLIKVFDRVVSTKELERKIEYNKIYRTWKEEVLRQEN